MKWLRSVTAIGFFALGYWAATGAALAQTFEERWSPIPKAHAEPSAPPQENSQSNQDQAVPQPQAVETPHAEVGRTPTKPSARARPAARRAFTGRASYYAYRGGKTASGEPFNRNALTAAHRTLPFGTRVRVTDAKTKKSVEVVITDRGPFSHGRVLDLSLAAAKALDIGKRGIIHVRAEIVGG